MRQLADDTGSNGVHPSDTAASVPMRILVVVDTEAFQGQPLNLSFLNAIPGATLLLLYRTQLRLDLTLTVATHAELHPLPAYEPSLADHLARITLFEARRGYQQVLLLAPYHEALQATVQFLREQGLVADFAHHADALAAFATATPQGSLPLSAAGGPPRIRIDPRTGKRRRRRRVKLPTSAEHMALVMQALLKNFRLGEVYSKTQISPIIHKETQRNVKELFPYKNLTGLYRYLLANDVIEEVDTKSFRVLRTDWQLPAEPPAGLDVDAPVAPLGK